MPGYNWLSTFNGLAANRLDGDLLLGLLMVALVDISELTSANFILKDVIVDDFWHGLDLLYSNLSNAMPLESN